MNKPVNPDASATMRPVSTPMAPGIIEKSAMRFILSLFRQIESGRLLVALPDGREGVYGNHEDRLSAELHVHDYRFFSQTLLGGDIGLGEAYMNGFWSSPELSDLMTLFIFNRHVFSDGNFATALISRMTGRIQYKWNQNTRSKSKKNISAHYDLSNEFFKLFLDGSMTYSCGYYNTDQDSLDCAQQNKINKIIEKAEIQKNDHVLEIGCGWGSFAIQAVRQTGCRVTGITISKKQFEYCRKRIAEAGLSDRIDIRLIDYRNLHGRFDKIISIEMLEAVGEKYLKTFFKCCDRLLKKDGLLVLQVITIPDQRYAGYKNALDWIQKHIFPGGHLPSLTALCNAMTSHSSFIIEELENIGIHYAKTLREWREKFYEREKILFDKGYTETFFRKWEYYFSSCEAAFKSRSLNDLQLVLTRANNTGAANLKLT